MNDGLRKAADEIIDSLDFIARDYDYGYALPTHDKDERNLMAEAVVKAIGPLLERARADVAKLREACELALRWATLQPGDYSISSNQAGGALRNALAATA